MMIISIGIATICGVSVFFITKNAVQKAYGKGFNEGYQCGKIRGLTDTINFTLGDLRSSKET